MVNESSVNTETTFDNPFRIEDLFVFDDEALRRMLSEESFGVTTERLAYSLQGASQALISRIEEHMEPCQRSLFQQKLRQPLSDEEVERARRLVLDDLFWELTYWKTPDLYEELTEGEQLHPGIFEQLGPLIRGRVVLDVGAGSGRATFECLRYSAKLVHAVEPSPGLLRILRQKCAYQPVYHRVVPHAGRFDAIPLPSKSVDVTLSCSAFTALPEQGGEEGLTELRRVTRSSGRVVLIWPRSEDRDWLTRHGFHYVTLPMQEQMSVHFRSWQGAITCAKRFYAHNPAVLHYILTKHQTDVPFSIIGVNPPRDYCWLEVE